MSKTLLTSIQTYLTDEEIRKLDALRGEIPRARIGARAIRRYLEDIENGRIILTPKGEFGKGKGEINKKR
jgi:hypothetical protein